MTGAELALKTGKLFKSMITDAFWDSFKGELGRVQVEILVYLYDNEHAQASEISETLNISKQHVSKIILKFINSGFVKEDPSSADGRCSILTLTDEGRVYIEKHIRISDASFEQLLARMDPDEQNEFRESMKYITELLLRYSDD